jgi:stress response protein YsnF
MMSNTTEYRAAEIRAWIGHTAVDINGDKVGTIEDVYEDDRGSGPEWFCISSGWFGNKRSFAPVSGSTADGDKLVLPWTKQQIKEGPHFEPDQIDDGDSLYSHYGYAYEDDDRTGDDDAMTRSEEEVNVSTRQREAGRARLRKWVETEDVNVTVPVRREVARLVTEPITDSNIDRALDGPEIRENEHDVVLHQEEVVVDKKVVPKERVRLETDTVEDEEVVDEQVRKERIGMESDSAGVDSGSNRGSSRGRRS